MLRSECRLLRTQSLAACAARTGKSRNDVGDVEKALALSPPHPPQCTSRTWLDDRMPIARCAERFSSTQGYPAWSATEVEGCSSSVPPRTTRDSLLNVSAARVYGYMKVLTITSLVLASCAVAVCSWLCLQVLEGQKQLDIVKQDNANLQRESGIAQKRLDDLKEKRADAIIVNSVDEAKWAREVAESYILALRGNPYRDFVHHRDAKAWCTRSFIARLEKEKVEKYGEFAAYTFDKWSIATFAMSPAGGDVIVKGSITATQKWTFSGPDGSPTVYKEPVAVPFRLLVTKESPGQLWRVESIQFE